MTETAPNWAIGDWMQTYTGKRFYPLSPRAEDIDPLDIAHALSLLCRYNGHVDRFYSVAEHCILMSEAVSWKNARWALLHDATEAYVGDMIRPLKRHMPEYRGVEDRVMLAICERFDLDPEMPDEVHEADASILLTERNALMPATRHQWDVDGLKPLPVTIYCHEPAWAEHYYIQRLQELGLK